MKSETAILHEIFSGIQGEGALVGVRQLFVRFHGCHLACRYCDTPAARGETPADYAVERIAGSREIDRCANPCAPDALLATLLRLQTGYPHHSVSLTGGEPLLQVQFLNDFLPRLHDAGLRSYLETNGMLPGALAALTTPPHFIAMDIKLPSATGGPARWQIKEQFLRRAIALPSSVQVKLVFTEKSLPDIRRAARLIAAVKTDAPVILQPVTPRPGYPPAPSPTTVLEAQRILAELLPDVRVIPQTHAILGQW